MKIIFRIGEGGYENIYQKLGGFENFLRIFGGTKIISVSAKNSHTP